MMRQRPTVIDIEDATTVILLNMELRKDIIFMKHCRYPAPKSLEDRI